MKWFAILLSVVILSLNAIPCADNESGHTHELSENHDHDSSEHEDHCSPFCTCDCCSTNVVFQLDITFFSRELAVVFQPQVVVYLDLYTTLFSNKIDQPPKIG